MFALDGPFVAAGEFGCLLGGVAPYRMQCPLFFPRSFVLLFVSAWELV